MSGIMTPEEEGALADFLDPTQTVIAKLAQVSDEELVILLITELFDYHLRSKTLTAEECARNILAEILPVLRARFEVEQDKICDDCQAIAAPKLRAHEAEVVKAEQARMKQLTWCAYCGKEYTLDTVTAEQIGEHIALCEKHPLFHAQKRVKELEQEKAEAVQAERKRVLDVLQEAYPAIITWPCFKSLKATVSKT